MFTPPEVLETHVRWLLELGYRFMTAGELAAEWRDGDEPPPGVAVLTFDDGWRDGLITATPLLEWLGIRATFYVCPNGFGKRFPRFGPEAAILTRDEARALHDAGMELGSHTFSHPDLRELSDSELEREVVESRQVVESLTGEPCLTLAYPSGLYDGRVKRAARRAGYELALDCKPAPWDRFAAPRWQPPPTTDAEAVGRKLELPFEESLTLG